MACNQFHEEMKSNRRNTDDGKMALNVLSDIRLKGESFLSAHGDNCLRGAIRMGPLTSGVSISLGKSAFRSMREYRHGTNLKATSASVGARPLFGMYLAGCATEAS